jgi:hypothetical protein
MNEHFIGLDWILTSKDFDKHASLPPPPPPPPPRFKIWTNPDKKSMDQS